MPKTRHGHQASVLDGGCAKRGCKLPNPVYLLT
jgi:hypothetical protein